MVLILHMSDDNCIERSIILIVAEYAGLTVEFHPGCKLGLCDKAPAYLKFHAQEPFLEIHETQLDVDDGTIVIGAYNIARFFFQFKNMLRTEGGTTFHGYREKLKKVFIEQWIGYSTNKVYRCANKYYHSRHKVEPPASVEFEYKTFFNLKNALEIFNQNLARRKTYHLVGNVFTVADIIVTCHLHFAFTNILVKSFTSQFPHVEKYFWNTVNEPNFQKILGNVEQFKVSNLKKQFRKRCREASSSKAQMIED